jgi:signal transduction histidine kinase
VWIAYDEGGIGRYDREGGGGWSIYGVDDGVADGHVWAATTSGLCRYDDHVTCLRPDSKGGLWIGTVDAGVSYHKDGQFSSFTSADGLANNRVWSIAEDRAGRIWFATLDGCVSCYDNGNWTTYTTADGLVDDRIVSICEDGAGNLWFGSNGYGLSRFDGSEWTTFTEADGLAHNRVKWIEEDRSGALWFGTLGGVSRYDGNKWTTFDVSNGLADNFVQSVLVDRKGDVWVATGMGGVSRYDGRRWVSYSQEDGLPSNWMTWIFEDAGGHLWFGTMNGGVSRFDGESFMTINRQDGIADNTVWAITQDKEGAYWFATFHGITRYEPQKPEPPPVFIDAVVTDRRYEKFGKIAIRSVVNHAIFEYRGMSFNTRPDGLLYRHRLIGYDRDWVYSRTRRVVYANLPVGSYVFEVEALDRDLVGSASPARLPLVVERDVRNEQIDELEQRVRERTEMLEKANRQLATSNTELEQFAYVASHDLQEPLRVMTSFLELLGRRLEGDLDESSQHYIERSVAAAARMRQLIEDLLTFSRVTTKARDFEATDCARIVEVVGDNLGIAIEESGGNITGGDGLPTVIADGGQLGQLFQNLIGNALKFRGERAPEIHVAAERGEGEWQFSVGDNGIGIDPQFGERIFRILSAPAHAGRILGDGNRTGDLQEDRRASWREHLVREQRNRGDRVLLHDCGPGRPVRATRGRR